ncbi:MAG: TonB-dependent receptor domain-containing protein [Terriglobia bacterium]
MQGNYSKGVVFAGSLCLMIVISLLCPMRTNCQGINVATLSGTVTDPSHAPIPGAQVTLQNIAQNARRQTVTNSIGSYTIPAILPGTYRLIIAARGFQQNVTDNIILTAGQGSTLNIELTLAKTVSRVVVTSAPPLLETTTSSLGGSVSSKEFDSMPLLGRNFTTMIDLLPGVAPVPNPDASYATSGVACDAVLPAVYGQRQRDDAVTVDGAPVLNYSQRIGVYPPPEAVQEMKVVSGEDSGAYGWASGASINVVTKSGTNQYHGDAWEYVRNNDLDARSFFDPQVLKFNWNQFGAAVGGPLVIPHLVSKKNAWYVFGWYEGVRVRSAAAYEALVPTPAQISGDFSALSTPIYNPYTTVLGSNGNILSRTQFPGNVIPSTLLNSVALAISKAAYPAPNLPAGAIPGVNYFNSSPAEENANQFSLRTDHQFGQNNSFFARYTDWRDWTNTPSLPIISSVYPKDYMNINTSETHVFSPTSLVTSNFSLLRDDVTITATAAADLAKQTGLTNVFAPVNGVDILPSFGIGTYASPGEYYTGIGPNYLYSWSEDAQKIMVRHRLSFGGTFMHQRVVAFQPEAGECFGPLQTGFGANTGDAFASFLLGLPYSASRSGTTPRVDLGYETDSLYFEDTFQPSKKLTLNLGLRWDHETPPNADPGLGTIDMDNGKYYWDHTNPVTGAPANIRAGIVPPTYRGYQPRFGIAYELSPKTVIRTSFGIFDNIYGIMQQSPINAAYSWPYAFPQSEGSLNLTLPTAFMQDPFPGPAVPSKVPSTCSQCMNTETSSSRQPYVYEYSFSVQRQITPSLMTQVAYFGSRGVKLMGQVLDNVATVPGTNPYQDRQPWPQYSPFVNNWYDEYNSWYNGMSVMVKKTYSKNLSFLVSYTWSHTMDETDSLANGGPLGAPASNPTRYNRFLFKGDAGYDIRNLLSASYIYAIPWKAQNRWLNGLVGNWQFSGILSGNTGVPTDVMLDFDNENIGAAGRVTEFPNLVGNPVLANPTPQEWFDPAAYQLPAFGTRGYAGRHAIFSDGELNWDTSLSKQFPLFRESRSLQFRADFFNLPNAHSFGLPNPFYDTPGFGSVSTVLENGRQIQVSLEFHF